MPAPKGNPRPRKEREARIDKRRRQRENRKQRKQQQQLEQNVPYLYGYHAKYSGNRGHNSSYNQQHPPSDPSATFGVQQDCGGIAPIPYNGVAYTLLPANLVSEEVVSNSQLAYIRMPVLGWGGRPLGNGAHTLTPFVLQPVTQHQVRQRVSSYVDSNQHQVPYEWSNGSQHEYSHVQYPDTWQPSNTHPSRYPPRTPRGPFRSHRSPRNLYTDEPSPHSRHFYADEPSPRTRPAASRSGGSYERARMDEPSPHNRPGISRRTTASTDRMPLDAPTPGSNNDWEMLYDQDMVSPARSNHEARWPEEYHAQYRQAIG